MAIKQYVLLDHLKPSIPIYKRINKNQRQRIETIPKFGIPNRVTFTTADGVTKVHRYKQGVKSVVQADQVKQQDIPANARFTTQERRDLEFHNNVLTTGKESVQKYLESLPYMQGVEGTIDNEKTPIYKLVDVAKDQKNFNDDFKKRLKAGQYIDSLDLNAAQEVVIRLYGSSYPLPKDGNEKEKLLATQNILINYMDEADDEGLEKLMKKQVSEDEKVAILVGQLVNAKAISFDALDNQISVKDGDKWRPIKEIPSSLPLEERQRQFINYLNSDSGKTLYDDLKNIKL